MGTQSTLSSLSHPATATLFRPQLEPTLRAGALPVLHHLARHSLQHMQYSASKKRQIWSEIVRELMFGAEGRLLTAVGTTTTSPLMLGGVRKVLWCSWTSLATRWGCCVTLREVLLPILQQTFPMEGEASNCRGSRQTVPNMMSQCITRVVRHLSTAGREPGVVHGRARGGVRVKSLVRLKQKVGGNCLFVKTSVCCL